MSSPFAHILNTNYIPTDDEAQQIQNYIHDWTNQLSHLDIEIDRVQIMLNGLRKGRDKISTDIKSHHALISPARRLPQDILQEIFVACLPSDRNAVMSTREAPVLLGHISSAWRNASYSTPRLWSSIHIPIPIRNINMDKLHERHETVKAWLGRSDICPLSISIAVQSAGPVSGIFSDTRIVAPQKDVLEAVIRTVLSFSMRWKHISLRIPYFHFSMLSALSEQDVPLIETYRISCFEWGDLFEWDVMEMLQAPRLRTLIVDFMNGYFLNLPICWYNLTELDVGDMGSGSSALTIEYVLILADICPNLITCRLTIYDESNGSIPRNSATFANLRTLSVVDIFDATELFKHLSMPSLRHITFSARYSHSDRPVSLLTLLSHTAHLDSLAFDWPESQPKENLFRCLELAPTITALRIVIRRYDRLSQAATLPSMLDDECLRRLLPTATDVHKCLCPRLRSLDCTNASFSEDLLFKVIEGRQDVPGPIRSDVAPLSRVHVKFDRQRSVDKSVELRPLIDAGLDIVFEYQEASLALYPWLGLSVVTPTLQSTFWG